MHGAGGTCTDILPNWWQPHDYTWWQLHVLRAGGNCLDCELVATAQIYCPTGGNHTANIHGGNCTDCELAATAQTVSWWQLHKHILL